MSSGMPGETIDDGSDSENSEYEYKNCDIVDDDAAYSRAMRKVEQEESSDKINRLRLKPDLALETMLLKEVHDARDREVKFIVSRKQLRLTNRRLVYVSPEKLEVAFARSPSYVGRLGAHRSKAAEIESRRRYLQALNFLKTGERVIVSSARMVDSAVTFADGKHRFCVYRDIGLKCVPISVPTTQFRTFKRRFRAPKSERLRARNAMVTKKGSLEYYESTYTPKSRQGHARPKTAHPKSKEKKNGPVTGPNGARLRKQGSTGSNGSKSRLVPRLTRRSSIDTGIPGNFSPDRRKSLPVNGSPKKFPAYSIEKWASDQDLLELAKIEEEKLQKEASRPPEPEFEAAKELLTAMNVRQMMVDRANQAKEQHDSDANAGLSSAGNTPPKLREKIRWVNPEYEDLIYPPKGANLDKRRASSPPTSNAAAAAAAARASMQGRRREVASAAATPRTPSPPERRGLANTRKGSVTMSMSSLPSSATKDVNSRQPLSPVLNSPIAGEGRCGECDDGEPMVLRFRSKLAASMFKNVPQSHKFDPDVDASELTVVALKPKKPEPASSPPPLLGPGRRKSTANSGKNSVSDLASNMKLMMHQKRDTLSNEMVDFGESLISALNQIDERDKDGATTPPMHRRMDITPEKERKSSRSRRPSVSSGATRRGATPEYNGEVGDKLPASRRHSTSGPPVAVRRQTTGSPAEKPRKHRVVDLRLNKGRVQGVSTSANTPALGMTPEQTHRQRPILSEPTSPRRNHPNRQSSQLSNAFMQALEDVKAQGSPKVPMKIEIPEAVTPATHKKTMSQCSSASPSAENPEKTPKSSRRLKSTLSQKKMDVGAAANSTRKGKLMVEQLFLTAVRAIQEDRLSNQIFALEALEQHHKVTQREKARQERTNITHVPKQIVRDIVQDNREAAFQKKKKGRLCKVSGGSAIIADTPEMDHSSSEEEEVEETQEVDLVKLLY